MLDKIIRLALENRLIILSSMNVSPYSISDQG